MSNSKPYQVILAKGFENPWVIVERPTGQEILTFEESREAKIQANGLNGGKGFRGHTPSYLLKSLSHIYQ